MKLAYFVHDLTDPAVRRRVRMLQAGGADLVVLGFRRAEAAPAEIEGAPVADLGRTYDARLGHRAAATAMAALTCLRWRGVLQGCEVVLARTLEMLAVAQAARTACGLRARLAYECLDIHRVMLADGVKGAALRRLERALMRHSDLLIVSSPAFLREYFAPLQGVGGALSLPSLLVENKVLELGAAPRLDAPPPGPPWRIAWLGAIRCRRSLAILHDLAARRPDLVEVRIHGRPAYSEFEDFDRDVSSLPNLRYGGSYGAADLPALYGNAHFAWAIDYMEAGLNSDWLLPNRLYEASAFAAVPIALKSVETGRRLDDWGFGLRLSSPQQLESELEQLTPAGYASLRAELLAVPRERFVAGLEACRRLTASVAAAGVQKVQGSAAACVSERRVA